MQHKGTKILETERLLLRRWKENDAEEAFAHWMNDPDVQLRASASILWNAVFCARTISKI